MFHLFLTQHTKSLKIKHQVQQAPSTQYTNEPSLYLLFMLNMFKGEAFTKHKHKFANFNTQSLRNRNNFKMQRWTYLQTVANQSLPEN